MSCDINITPRVVLMQIKNYFPDKFVYLRLPFEDKEEENMSSRYNKAFSFIQRVVAAKGKVGLTCLTG
jgi:hypothetical protein